MKKIKLDTSRLQLSKEKIATLSKQDLYKIRGGTIPEYSQYDCSYTCETFEPCETEICSTPEQGCGTDADGTCTCTQGDCPSWDCSAVCPTGEVACG